MMPRTKRQARVKYAGACDVLIKVGTQSIIVSRGELLDIQKEIHEFVTFYIDQFKTATLNERDNDDTDCSFAETPNNSN